MTPRIFPALVCAALVGALAVRPRPIDVSVLLLLAAGLGLVIGAPNL